MIYTSLYDWQQRLVDRFKDRQSFGLFLDMGLGKTPLSLALAEINNCSKVIVVTINAKATEGAEIKGSWLNWASKSKLNYAFHSKYSKNLFSETSNDLLLINYESLFARNTAGFQLKEVVNNFIKGCKGHNVALIVDESHKTKTMQSKQTKAIMLMQKLLNWNAENVYTYLLTGTPFTTGYIDLYTQLKILGYEETKGQFTDKFCIMGNLPGLLGWQQPIVGYKNIDDLFRLVHRFAITIKSEEVADLPEQIFVKHVTPFSKQFEFYTTEFMRGFTLREELLSRKVDEDLTRYGTESKVNNPFFRNIAYPSLNWLAETNGVFWLRARQLSIGFNGNSSESKWYDTSRLTLLKQFLEENEDNYVLFYNYTPELLELYQICNDLGYKIDVYCGEAKSMYWYEQFSKLPDSEKLVTKKRIILANFASGSTGMNWQEYSKCIIFSLPVYRDWEQGLKRVHRLGQKNTVIYHIFQQHNWLDISMMKALEQKTEYTQDMFDADLKRIDSIMKDAD